MLAQLCLILAGALPLINSWTFFSAQLVRPLKNYADISTREVLDRAAGVIVVGGFTGNGMGSTNRQEPQIGGAGERFIEAVELARLCPKKQVWFSRFSGQLPPQDDLRPRALPIYWSSLVSPYPIFHLKPEAETLSRTQISGLMEYAHQKYRVGCL